jgi:hypothetical protein
VILPISPAKQKVLGVSAASKRADKEHEAFKALHEDVLADTDDPGLKAFLTFLRGWTPERFALPDFSGDMLGANFVFRLDGENTYLHERPAAQGERTCPGAEEYSPQAAAIRARRGRGQTRRAF